MPTKIYSYGCKQPDPANRAILDKAYLESHRYYNQLVEIERGRLAAVTKTQLDHSDRLTKATAARDAIEKELADVRSRIKKTKSRGADKTGADELKEQAKRLRASLKTARTEVTEARAELRGNEALREALNEIERDTNMRRKAVYAASPLFWGSKNHVAARVEAAASRSFGEVRFRRWTRDGVIYCQVMGGIDSETAYSGRDTRVQIERTSHRKLCVVRMRVGSTEKKDPVWVTVNAYVHRPFPDGAKIMGVQIARREGVQYRMGDGKYHPVDDYFVQFTVRYPEPEAKAVPDLDAVGVDLGWRLKPDDSLRVAAWYDTAGNSGDFTLPRNLLNRWLKCRDLQSIRDRLFNEATDQLKAYCQMTDPDLLPDFLKAVAPHLHLWRSPFRLARFVDFWTRHPGDDTIWAVLSHWRDREAHLYQWQRNNETKAQRIRLDMFRAWAKKMSGMYKTIVMEDFDVARMRRNPNPEDKVDPVVKYWRNAAAIGLLRSVLSQTGRSALVPSQRTTMNCHKCGGVNNWDRRELDHTCRHCGERWDQDDNAAKNLLQSFLDSRVAQPAAPPDDQPADGKYVGRWQRRKANRSQPGSQEATGT